MKIVRTKVIYLLAILLGLAACDKIDPGLNQLQDTLRRDAKVLYDEGATRLTSKQAKQHVSGNTELWKEGAIYYDPNGNLELYWNKIRIKGNWEMLDSGTVCLDVPRWNITCHYYLDHDGATTAIDDGKIIGTLKVKPGKHLGRRP
jgi:hypothetical protein